MTGGGLVLVRPLGGPGAAEGLSFVNLLRPRQRGAGATVSPTGVPLAAMAAGATTSSSEFSSCASVLVRSAHPLARRGFQRSSSLQGPRAVLRSASSKAVFADLPPSSRVAGFMLFSARGGGSCSRWPDHGVEDLAAWRWTTSASPPPGPRAGCCRRACGRARLARQVPVDSSAGGGWSALRACGPACRPPRRRGRIFMAGGISAAIPSDDDFKTTPSGKLSEAIDHWYDSGLDDLVANLHRAFGASNVDAAYTHWGSAFKAAASELGLPVGDYPRSRPPQPPLPDAQRNAVHSAYVAAGLVVDEKA